MKCFFYIHSTDEYGLKYEWSTVEKHLGTHSSCSQTLPAVIHICHTAADKEYDAKSMRTKDPPYGVYFDYNYIQRFDLL